MTQGGTYPDPGPLGINHASGIAATSCSNLFPHFLAPAGLAALLGLVPYAATGGELIAAMIAVAAVLSAISIAATVWLVYRREPAAAVTLVMVILGIPLIGGGSGFAVFKLAMYIQPFLLLTLVLGLSLMFRIGR